MPSIGKADITNMRQSDSMNLVNTSLCDSNLTPIFCALFFFVPCLQVGWSLQSRKVFLASGRRLVRNNKEFQPDNGKRLREIESMPGCRERSLNFALDCCTCVDVRGFAAQVALLPESDIGVVLLTNSDSADGLPNQMWWRDIIVRRMNIERDCLPLWLINMS